MLGLLTLLFSILLLVFSGVYVAYFTYTRAQSKKTWNFNIDASFQPRVSLLVPVNNEERTIESKLQNILESTYPKEKIEVIIADDGSDDETLERTRRFLAKNPPVSARIVTQNPRAGKSRVLNKALEVSTGEIVVVSDADTLWPSTMLDRTMPYLSSPEIGAVTGWSANRNAESSWTTKSEKTYLDFIFMLRLGESKVHSTIRFEGGFCAYKTSSIEKFDDQTGADDSGTALEVIQHGFRAVLAPEAMFYTSSPTLLTEKLKTKTRRANQLLSLWVKCLKLMLKRRLLLPKKLAVPEIFLFIFNPIIFLFLITTTLANIILFPFSAFSLVVLASVAGLLLFARKLFFEVLIHNLVLLFALLTLLFGRRYIMWEKSRT